MDILHAIILGLLQGLTEFLPISSSAHLILLPKLMDWADQGLLYDVVAHFGSLLALLLYFRKDLARMSAGWVNSFSPGRNRDGDLVWFLVIATVPICVAGLLFHHAAERLRDPQVIAGATVLFGCCCGGRITPAGGSGTWTPWDSRMLSLSACSRRWP